MIQGPVGWAGAAFLLLTASVFLFLVKRYEVRQLRELVAILNTKGGNLLLLSFFTMAFFYSSVQLFYYALESIKHGQLTPENTILLMAVQFVVGPAFGGSFGALITLLSGEVRHNERQSDRSGNGSPAAAPPPPDDPKKDPKLGPYTP